MTRDERSRLAAGILFGVAAPWAGAAAPSAASPEPSPVPGPSSNPGPTTSAAAPSDPRPAGMLLRYKFIVGRRMSYSMTMDNRGTVAVGTKNTPLDQHTEVALHETVTDIDKVTGNATIQLQIDSLTSTMNGQVMPLPAAVLGPLEKPMTMVMTPTGKMTAGQLPGLASPMGSIQSTASLPDGPVSPGDSWNYTEAVPGAGVAEQITASLGGFYHHEGHVYARVNQSFDVSFTGKSGAAGPTDPSQNGSMRGTGITLFDTDLGWPKNADFSLHMDTHKSIAPGGKGPTQDAHSVMDMRMTMTLDTAG